MVLVVAFQVCHFTLYLSFSFCRKTTGKLMKIVGMVCVKDGPFSDLMIFNFKKFSFANFKSNYNVNNPILLWCLVTDWVDVFPAVIGIPGEHVGVSVGILVCMCPFTLPPSRSIDSEALKVWINRYSL